MRIVFYFIFCLLLCLHSLEDNDDGQLDGPAEIIIFVTRVDQSPLQATRHTYSIHRYAVLPQCEQSHKKLKKKRIFY